MDYWWYELLRGLGQMFFGLGFVGIAIAIYKSSKNKTELKKLEEKRRIMELEIESQNTKLKLLSEENARYDKLIEKHENTRH